MSLVLATLYCLLVNPGIGSSLYADKWMIPVEDGKAQLRVALPGARYRLKVKHVHDDAHERRVLVNGREYAPQKTRLKKTIRTDYFTLPEEVVAPDNRITVVFAAEAPKDIDVRLSNYAVLPRESLSYDVFPVFRSPGQVPMPGLVRWATAYLFFLIILLIACAELAKKGVEPVAPIRRAARPFTIVAILTLLHNALPLGPYRILLSPFFFGTAFVLSFVLMLVFIVPWRMHCE